MEEGWTAEEKRGGCSFNPDSDEGRSLFKDFDYVRFTVADLHGIGRCKSVPRRHLEHYVKRGVDIYAGSLALSPRSDSTNNIKEFLDVNLGNLVLLPAAGTLASLPWAADGKFKVGEVLCEAFWTKPYHNGAHQIACPRYMARKQLGRLSSLGYSLFSSFEIEFAVYKQRTGESLASLPKPLFTGHDIFSTQDLSQFESYLYTLETNLHAVGVDVGTLQTEFSSGQFEFALIPSHGITPVDSMFRAKHVIKEVTLHRDKTMEAVFMTKPDVHDASSGLHYNHSLWSSSSSSTPNNGKMNNAFYDITKPDGLSDIARYWIAGLVKHAAGLSALCSPTVNCYRRLHSEWCPSLGSWGIDNRLAAFRVKNSDASETYIENRLSSSAANPYLVLAATVAAGISGVVNKLECPPQHQGNELMLPKTLSEALDALESDKVLVEALGEDFIRWFVTIKREYETNVLKGDNIEQERNLYWKML